MKGSFGKQLSPKWNSSRMETTRFPIRAVWDFGNVWIDRTSRYFQWIDCRQIVLS
jgi:hypothetical protein